MLAMGNACTHPQAWRQQQCTKPISVFCDAAVETLQPTVHEGCNSPSGELHLRLWLVECPCWASRDSVRSSFHPPRSSRWCGEPGRSSTALDHRELLLVTIIIQGLYE